MTNTNTTNDGGPAFPGKKRRRDITEYPPSVFEPVAGMSMRDYFAGQALVGCFNFWVQVNAKATIGDPDPAAITKLAYEYADHMLKARKQ